MQWFKLYHHEGISNPQRRPALWTWWDLNGLTVNGNHHGRSFTHCASEWITESRLSFTAVRISHHLGPSGSVQWRACPPPLFLSLTLVGLHTLFI